MPTLTDTELLQYCPPDPCGTAVLGTTIIVPDLYTDAFAVFDATTETSKKFTGIHIFGSSRNVVTYGGYAWTIGCDASVYPYVLYLCRIGSDGSVTKWQIDAGSSVIRGYPAWVAVGDGKLFVTYKGLLWGDGFFVMFDPSAGTVSNFDSIYPAATSRKAVSDGSAVYITGTELRRSASDGTAMPDLASGPPHAYGYTLVDTTTDYLWYTDGTSVKVWDLPGNASIASVGVGFTAGAPAFGPNDLVYVTGTSSAYTGLAVIEKASKAVGGWTFSTARQKRIAVGAANGKMYAFAGETPV